MPNSAPAVVRVVALAAILTAFETTAPSSARAQALDAPASKLDAVLVSQAVRPLGRTRVIVQFKNACDVRVITSRRGRALRCQSNQQQVAELDNSALESVASDPRVERVMVDRPAFATLARTTAATGAKLVQQQTGYTGHGVGVAIIDSGVTSWHDDLYLCSDPARTYDRIAHFKDFTKDLPAGGASAASDEYGHGTHVAGIIASCGYDSDGARTGVAPGAHLIVLKVLDADGNGFISDVIAALDYAVANKDALNIRVINLSVASGVFESYRHDPLTQAARRAADAGIVVVTAAGNLGTNDNGQIQYGGITSPGNAPWVLTVGASSHQGTTRRSDDVVAGFSSRGPTYIDQTAKPDVVAPGVGIESMADPNSTLAATNSAYLVAGTHDSRYKPYLSLSGTSMAAPVVAGIVAQMLEANPRLTPNEVKAYLQFTAQVKDDESYLAQGAGLVNAVGAVRMAKFAADTESGIGQASDVIEDETVPWARHLFWGNYRVTGGVPLPGSNAWDTTTTWGAMKAARGRPVVWGARTLDVVSATGARDNIVWATAGRENIVWATGGRDNIVWATGHRENIVWATGGRDNIVWATGNRENIVWATRGRDNIVWATRGRENIVWATGNRDNIVWATRGRDNIVWATAFAENLVWKNDCGGRDCPQLWGTADDDGRVRGTARPFDNIVWATGNRDNIVWATGSRDNIVWATAAPGQVLWPEGRH
ncbi:MAG TPA: S8 family peptidase [Vicinamibacterales bacterium]|nr:S8 family peptidase [Vicinamibacterales bacterium]